MGMKKTCLRYSKVKTPRGKEYRCSKFRNGAGKPPCKPGLKTRSPGLLRGTVRNPRHCGRQLKRRAKR